MSNDFVYSAARVRFGRAQLDWTSAPVNAMLVSAGYSPNRLHTTVADIPVDAIITRDSALTGKAITGNGVCSGSIPLYEAFLSVVPVAALILYELGGSDATSKLIYYSSTGIGFPFTPNGFDCLVTYDLLNGGWFQV